MHVLLILRYEDLSDVAVGHFTDAWECSLVVLLRFLHLRHRWSPTVGGYTKTTLRTRSTTKCLQTQVCLKYCYYIFKD